MGRAPKTCDTCCDTRKRVCARRRRQTYSRCRRVLFVVCVKRKDTVHCAGQDWVNFVIFSRHCKAHAQEVRSVIQIVAWIHEWLTNRVFVCHRSNSWHFGYHTNRRDFALPWIRNVSGVVVECGHRTNNTGHDGHRVGIAAEATEQIHHLFV